MVVDTRTAARITPEEFRDGAGFETIGRTITEADVVGFAGLTDDWNPHHVNRHWMAANSPFGDRIAHGMLVTAVAAGMVPPQLRHERSMRTISGVFKKPVMFGDSIRVAGRAGSGGATIDLRVLNQDDELCAKLKLGFERPEPPPVEQHDESVADSLTLTQDELVAGRPYRTPPRTMTEAHVVGYGIVTGDWSPVHADAEWAAKNDGGRRTVHELLLLGVSVGMMPIDVANLVAARRCDVDFVRPVAIGDTIHVEGRLTDRTPAGEGLVQDHFRVRTVNQRGETALAYDIGLVMKDEG